MLRGPVLGSLHLCSFTHNKWPRQQGSRSGRASHLAMVTGLNGGGGAFLGGGGLLLGGGGLLFGGGGRFLGGGGRFGASTACRRRRPAGADAAGAVTSVTVTRVPAGAKPITVPSALRCSTMLVRYRPCSRKAGGGGGGFVGGGGFATV